MQIEKDTFQNYVAAGAFISTVHDLTLWNSALHGGKLQADSGYQLMMTKQPNTSRKHPIFGKTDYGYGVTIDTKTPHLQLGLTGFVPGFASLNYYFPESETSLVILSNLAWDPYDFNNTFFYHTQLLKMVRDSDLLKRRAAAKP